MTCRTLRRRLSSREHRALRRSLANISPANSDPQLQSPLYKILPREIRSLVFEFAICQTVTSDEAEFDARTSHQRPKHGRPSAIGVHLLRTCRYVYYETQVLLLRSVTHHVYDDQFTSYRSRKWDHYLFHLSSQSGQHLHHIHTVSRRTPDFCIHLQEHLHWRKVTWTISAPYWDFESSWESDSKYAERLSIQLAQVLFPIACEEVTLEFETLRRYPQHRRILRRVCKRLSEVELERRDKSKLKFTRSNCLEYTWEASTSQSGGWMQGSGSGTSDSHHALRLCWRAQRLEREYMHFDHWDCLRSNRLRHMPFCDISDDERSD